MSTKSAYVEVKSQTRSGLAQQINAAITQIGPDRIITVVLDEGGKFSEGGARLRQVLAVSKAYIFYRVD